VRKEQAELVGVEIDMVVSDSLRALELYEAIFPIERVEVTAYDRGLNEAVFTLFGTRFHLLDENPEYGLVAPKENEGKPMWLNVLVPDIQSVYAKALQNGCSSIQPVTEMPEMGASNAIFFDPFGFVWMLHQMHRVVSFEERSKYLEEKLRGEQA
jgi:PhnB protein